MSELAGLLSTPDTPARVWNPRRQTLHRRVAAQNSDLGYLYKGAIDLLEVPASLSGSARHRLVLISHNVRELILNAPDLFDDVERTRRGRTDSTRLLANLAKAWDEDWDALGDHSDHARFLEDERGPFAVRGGLLAAAAVAITEQRAGTARNEARQAATVLGRPGSRDDATLKAWLKTQRWFTKHAHLDSSREGGDVPSDDIVLGQLGVVENILYARLAPFFEVKDELDELLAEANERESGAVTP